MLRRTSVRGSISAFPTSRNQTRKPMRSRAQPAGIPALSRARMGIRFQRTVQSTVGLASKNGFPSCGAQHRVLAPLAPPRSRPQSDFAEAVGPPSY